jgi:transposase
LATELHLGPSAIARKMGITKHTAIDLLKKYAETGLVKDRPGRGRKRKLTKEVEKKIMKKAKKEKDATEIAREIASETGITVHQQTIRNIIKDHKQRYLVRQPIEELSDHGTSGGIRG